MRIIYIKEQKFTEEELLKQAKDFPTFEKLGKSLGVGRATVAKAIKVAYPDFRPRAKLYVGLLECKGMRLCSSCELEKSVKEFYICASTPSGYGTQCKSCAKELAKKYYNSELSSHRIKLWNKENRGHKNHLTRERAADVKQRTPGWANKEKIKEIYVKCPEGYHVDHIIPLKGELVSGLHVETNLQYLTVEENLKKSNKYTPE